MEAGPTYVAIISVGRAAKADLPISPSSRHTLSEREVSIKWALSGGWGATTCTHAQ